MKTVAAPISLTGSRLGAARHVCAFFHNPDDRLSRAIGHMEWGLEDRPGVEDLVEYEVRLNYILPQYNDPIICVYDLAKFGGAVVVDMLRTHPMVIIGGLLQENPFFVPPDEFLRQLRARRATRTTY